MTAAEEAAAKRVIPIPLAAFSRDPRIVRDPRLAARIMPQTAETHQTQSNATSSSAAVAPKNITKTNILAFPPLPIIKKAKIDEKDSKKEEKKLNVI